VFKLPEPPPDIRLTPSWYPDGVATPGAVEVYSPTQWEQGKPVRRWRPLTPFKHKTDWFIVVEAEGEPMAVWKLRLDDPDAPERLLTWPFDEDV